MLKNKTINPGRHDRCQKENFTIYFNYNSNRTKINIYGPPDPD